MCESPNTGRGLLNFKGRGGAASRATASETAKLRESDQINWSRAMVDSASIRAVGGGGKTGPNPTDRRKPGSKHHLITYALGIPLAAILTGANYQTKFRETELMTRNPTGVRCDC